MNSFLCAYLVCGLFAAATLAKSNNDTQLVTGVQKDLFGQCYSKCKTQRAELLKANDDANKCSLAEKYTSCIKEDADCQKESLVDLDILNKEIQDFCAKTTAASAAGTTKTTPTTTPTTAPTTTPTPNQAPTAAPAPPERKRRAVDIDSAITNLLKKTFTCSEEMCLTEKNGVLLSNPSAINCTQLGSYGKCLVKSCSSLKPEVTKYNEKCGATNIQLFSYALFMAGLLFKILF